MPFRNDPDLLNYARQGYQDTAFEGLETSAVWYAWKAGEALRKSGRTGPVKCAPSRGTSIRIETAGGMEFLVRFDKRTDAADLERLDD